MQHYHAVASIHVGRHAFPLSDSIQLVPVCGVNFCWYDAMELELSLLVTINLQCELGDIQCTCVHFSFRLYPLQLLFSIVSASAATP